MPTPVFVLTVSGSDSSGCAGMQTDNRAIHACGAHPLNVLTAVTVQTTSGVAAMRPLPPEFIAAQLSSLLHAYPVAAVKSGMLVNADIVQVLAQELRDFPDIPYILDPVCRSSSGAELLDAEGVRQLRTDLLPRTQLLTPNLAEALALADDSRPPSSPEAAAASLSRTSAAVLLKGGHADGPDSADRLFQEGHHTETFTAPRLHTENARGTGCALASAIAARLAQGEPLPDAIRFAKHLLHSRMAANATQQWPGQGPAFV